MEGVFCPSGKTLGDIDRQTRNWFQQASPEEQSTKGIFYPGILFQEQFYSAHHLVLEKNGTWTLSLVKSGVKLKERYLQEADWIKRGFGALGLSIHLVRLIHPNKEYNRGDALEPKDFFTVEPITHDLKYIRRDSKDLSRRITQDLSNKPRLVELEGAAPSKTLNGLCSAPEICPFCGPLYEQARSTQAKNQGRLELKHQSPLEHRGYLDLGVSQLFRGGGLGRKLQDAGVHSLVDLEKAPDSLKRLLKPRHWTQAKVFQTRVPHINRSELKKWFESLKWPLYFLDFESVSSAVPQYPGTYPWEQVVFAYSLCKANSVEKSEWTRSYISPPGIDARETIVDQLLEGTQEDKGTVLVYGKDFELFALRRLSECFPEKRTGIQGLSQRIRDLQEPFVDFFYYHPAQGSKISLKTLLPILSSGPVHGDLEVQNGADATFGYYFLSFPNEQDPKVPSELAPPQRFLELLDEYSRLDTEGLFQIVQVLYELSGSS